MKREIRIALIGNPNIGKTTIFNVLTGLRQHVGNWPGVTVEKKTGRLSRNGYDIEVVDLPGTYSLTAYSADEIIARDFILEGNPDVVVQVVDATNMERNLYLTLQVAELGVPMVIALNMVDLARAQGDGIDHERLSASQGIPIFYDPGTGKPAVLWESWTQPRPNRYDGPVAILVSPYTIRNGRDCLVVRDE
ncbi:MAG TPA: FeoB small GTPase domain-containing protein, partial [Methanoculleus sp.]|nr:FeoB small GTPase domain-containing protein [Methanoculleus sp.]